jgi:signal transduction histidine kinase
MQDIYAAKHDYKHAFEALMSEKTLQDSLYNIEKQKEINNLQSVYELEQSNAKVSELEKRMGENRTKRQVTFAVAGILALAFILLFFVYRKIKKLNTMLVAREKELQKLNNEKDKLFSIIGHDLRGPIGNIPVALGLLKEETDFSEENRQLLDELIDHTKASVETLNELLLWGQSQIKGIQLSRVQFQAKELIQNEIKLVKNYADRKHINIADNTAEDTTVYADKAHFDFIIRNLLSNAVKFTYNNGSITIAADKNKMKGYVVFSVSDNGVGLSNEEMAHIFEPSGYSRSGTANEQGSSLGLTLCREFVAQNGGSIWVESEKGKGSIFYFSLPKDSQ